MAEMNSAQNLLHSLGAEKAKRTILLDTNLIYYLCGMSEGPIAKEIIQRYITSMEANNSFFISSVSLYEIIARFHNHANCFRRLMYILRNNHIRIIDSPYFKKISLFQSELTQIKQKQLEMIWKEIKENKVDVESRYATVIFVLVFASALVFECVDNVNEVPSSFYQCIELTLTVMRDIALQCFQEAFKNGYSNADCERQVKNEFSNLLQYFLPPALVLCKDSFSWTADDEGNYQIPDLSKEEYIRETVLIAHKLKKVQRPTLRIAKQSKQYDKRIGKDGLLQYLRGLSSTITELFAEETTQEYIYSIVQKCLTHGGVFYKNDINDALILSLVSKNEILLTLDAGIIGHMTYFKASRVEYMHCLREIEVLKQYSE